eukprot:gnl/Hemi2/787_TR288_c0_g16_i1.p2 gnl/Hemi2/787_TR288_c0_g16~~gnl/Hemi2/787_TR288_c0_g16_i1.p2  ORF type:complete len:309 (-),score=106.97 gnl/Hemi2/787_TR288_c0_g16_i1:412-1338(-)
MQSRLADLQVPRQSFALAEGVDDDAEGHGFSGDIEMGVLRQQEVDPNMRTFFSLAKDIKDALKALEANLTKIAKAHQAAIRAFKEDEKKRENAKIDNLMHDTNTIILQTKSKLQELEKDNKEYNEMAGAGSGQKDPMVRMRGNMLQNLSKKFVTMMTGFQELQADLRNQKKDLFSRRYKLAVNPDATDDEITKALASGAHTDVFKKSILQQQVNATEQTLAEVTDRYQDVIKLEQSIAELHQMFVDMAILVEQQGEMIDQIEFNVSTAKDHIEEGQKQLSEIVRKGCCGCGCCGCLRCCCSRCWCVIM